MNLLRIPLYLVLASSAIAPAEIILPPVLSGHMVLQRDVAVPIWGTAAAGEEISVSIAGQTKSTAAGADGKWKLRLDPLSVAEGLTLTVKGTNTIEVKDVLVGEVWLGSGQSNMAGAVRTFKGDDPGLQKTLAAAPYPRIRLMQSGGKGWQLATPASVDAYSAILFAFGSRLQEDLDVPVGLILGAVGGTPSGYWLTEEMYRGDAACQEQAKTFAETYDFEAAMKVYERYMTAWKANAEKATGERVGRKPAVPRHAGECAGEFGHLYVKHVEPFQPYAIRGVLWDQGEGGTGITGVDQYHVMGALIQGWRKAWEQDFPFLYVQKPSGGGPAWDPTNPTTQKAAPFSALPAEVPKDIDGVAREVHIKIQKYPNTAMVTSTDLGGMTHPTNKSGYADRARQVALGFVYGREIEFCGPLYASHEIAGDKVRVHFTHLGQGLAMRHSDKLQGFQIAGADKKFVWADAVIDGDTVLVSSPAVSSPAAVRYAWSGKASWANLFNKDGLPAQTFRTDDWGDGSAGGTMMNHFFIAITFAVLAPLRAAEVLIVETLEGPVTAAEVTAFKNYMRTVPVPKDNLSNAMVYGVGGTSVESLGRIYEITGDRELLDRMLCFTDAMLAGRNDPETGLIIWTGKRDVVWPNSMPEEGKPAYAGTETGDVAGHIAHAARLILENKKLAAEKVSDGDPFGFGATYRERALCYVSELDHTMDTFVLKWIVRPDSLRYYSPDAPAYDAASRPGSTNLPVPWNQQMMLNNGFQRLAECHAILGDDPDRMKRYDAIVQASIDWFFEKVVRITVNGHECYRWTYAAEDPMRHFEDSAHGGYDVGGLYRAYVSGRYRITAEQMKPFANTVLQVMARPGPTFTGRTDGEAAGKRPPGTLRGHWIDLCEFAPELLPLLHQANRGRIKGSADTTANLLWARHRIAKGKE